MVYQGNAQFRFDATHEILMLGETFTQAPNYAGGASTPGIAPPAADAEQRPNFAMLTSALNEGGHYFSISPLSDFPVLGVVDREGWEDMTFESFPVEEIIWLGYEPVKIERKIKRPMILPPQARYVLGHRNVQDLYPLGGVGDAGLTPTSGYCAWHTSILFGPTPYIGPNVHAKEELYRYRTINAIVAPLNDSTARVINFPSVVFGPDQASTAGQRTGVPANLALSTWNIRKMFLGNLYGQVAITMNAADKALQPSLITGNKLFIWIALTGSGVGVPTLPAQNMLEVQNGGFYE